MAEFNWSPEELQEIVDNNRLVLFMKGTPEEPQCGFSNRASMVLQQLGQPFVTVNILSDHRAIPSSCAWSDFPTMSQIFLLGDLIVRSDIALDMYQSGELQQMLMSREPSYVSRYFGRL